MSKIKYNTNREIEEFIREKQLKGKKFSKEDIAYINQFIGYGGMGRVGKFSPEELKGLLSEYYTPIPAIEKMVGLALAFGYKMGTPVLEPACGTGRVLHYFSPKTKVDAFEINPVSYQIAKLNFPTFNIQQKYFNQEFVDRTGRLKSFKPKYKLVIGNPPYGKFKGIYTRKERKELGVTQYEDYFITRSLDLLEKGGLLSFIVPSRFLENGDSRVKDRISEQADLLEAYRLPNRIFEQTQVQTDIIIMKKK